VQYLAFIQGAPDEGCPDTNTEYYQKSNIVPASDRVGERLNFPTDPSLSSLPSSELSIKSCRELISSNALFFTTLILLSNSATSFAAT
jgi:hypothetical protein